MLPSPPLSLTPDRIPRSDLKFFLPRDSFERRWRSRSVDFSVLWRARSVPALFDRLGERARAQFERELAALRSQLDAERLRAQGAASFGGRGRAGGGGVAATEGAPTAVAAGVSGQTPAAGAGVEVRRRGGRCGRGDLNALAWGMDDY